MSQQTTARTTAGRILIIGPAVALFALFGYLLFQSRPPAELGAPAPAFSLPELGPVELIDARVELGAYEGTPVVINFWASWCEPCKDEAPELARVAREREGEVVFIGVNIMDGREEALAFVRDYDIGFINARDRAAGVAKQYGVIGIPETVFVDASGRMVGKFIGAFSPGQLDELVDDLINLGPDEVLQIVGRGESQPVP